MMRRQAYCLVLLMFTLAAAGAGARERVPPDGGRGATALPFALPVRAKVRETAADGKGWRVSGEIAVSFEQAKVQLGVKVAAAGWAHVHTIPLGKDRILEAWTRGNEELTLMVWRIVPGRSGFSYGLSSKAGVNKR